MSDPLPPPAAASAIPSQLADRHRHTAVFAAFAETLAAMLVRSQRRRRHRRSR